MAILDWSQVFTLTNPYTLGTDLAGPLLLNHDYGAVGDDGFGIFKVVARKSNIDFDVRATKQNMPQANGSRLPRRFLTGAEAQLVVQLWETDDEIACGERAQAMADCIQGAIRSLLNAGDNQGRLAWAVPGRNDRMLDDVRMLGYPKVTLDEGVAVVTFTLDSVFPYAQDLTQQLLPVPDGSTVSFTNDGNADYSPVIKVNQLNGVVGGGDVSAFTIINTTTGLQFVYDAAQPGGITIAGGQYGELDNFKNTFYLNGDSSNLKAGVVQLSSEYFDLVVGQNEIAIDGCDCDVLWAPAWA